MEHCNQPCKRPLRHPKFHFVFSMVHIISAIVLLILEIIAYGVSSLEPAGYHVYGVGIWVGNAFLWAGIITLCARKKDCVGTLVGALVWDILAAVLAFIGMILSIVELVQIYDEDRKIPLINDSLKAYMTAKAAIILSFCILVGISVMVHSIFACHDYCLCCYSEEQRNVFEGRPRHGYPVVTSIQTSYPSQQAPVYVLNQSTQNSSYVQEPSGGYRVEQGAYGQPPPYKF